MQKSQSFKILRKPYDYTKYKDFLVTQVYSTEEQQDIWSYWFAG